MTRSNGGDGNPAPGAHRAVEPAGRHAGERQSWTRFALIFGVLAVGSELAYHTVVVESDAIQVYLRILAHGSGIPLSWLAPDVVVEGARIRGARFSVEVGDGCDAIQICSLFFAAVIAFPVSLRRRLRGIALGLLWLQFLNLLRIISLFLIGSHYASVFMTFHKVIWPTFLVVVTVASWVIWVLWEYRVEPESSAAS